MPSELEIASIFLAAAAYVAFATFLNKKLGVRERMKFLQAQMNGYNKELQEAAKANDERRVKQLQMRDKEISGYMMEMMWLPWKSAIFVIPVFLIIIGTGSGGFLGIHFNGLIPPFFQDFVITLPFGLHPSEIFSLRILSPSTYGSRGFFVVCAIFSGILIESVLGRLEAKPAEKKA